MLAYLNDPTNGAMSEKFLTGGVTTWRDYIVSDNGLVAERFNTGGTIAVDYVIGDHLGSTGSVTGSTGTVTERNSFDAWGLRRNANGTDAASCNAISSAITRGFTGQESIDPACAINFNARLQDPSIARFMSADPFVNDPMDGQSFNRLSYVTNNPLNATDPSGYDIVCNNGVCREVEPTTPVESVTVTGVRHYTEPEPLWEATGAFGPPGPGGLTVPNGPPREEVEVDGRRWPRQRISLPLSFFLTSTNFFISPATAAELQRDPNDAKPRYCSSLGYKIGNAVDDTIGGGIQDIGTGVVLGGVAVEAYTWWTGYGAGIGAGIMGFGGTVYAGGTAVSEFGNGVKFLSGQSSGVTAGEMLSIPAMRLGPVGRIATDKLLKFYLGRLSGT